MAEEQEVAEKEEVLEEQEVPDRIAVFEPPEQAEQGDKEQQGQQQLAIDHMTQDDPRDRANMQDCFGRLVMIEVAVHKLPPGSA